MNASLRLTYEPLWRKHAHELFDALADPRVYEFIGGQSPTASVEQLAEEFGRMAAGPPVHRHNEWWWNYTVRLCHSGLAIGRLQTTILGDRAEVAYLFGPAYWGQGYAAEAMCWLHERLREDGTASTFWATVTPGNDRSIRLLRRLGYEAVFSGWPDLTSYDPGDLIFRRSSAAT